MASKGVQPLSGALYAESSDSSSEEGSDAEDKLAEENDKQLIENLKLENEALKLKVAFFEIIAHKTMELTDRSDQEDRLAETHAHATHVLKRRHTQALKAHAQRIEALEEENDELHAENDGLKAQWSNAFDCHAELIHTQERLHKANKDWETERNEKLKAMDELESAKSRAWTWEMMCRHQGEMPQQEEAGI